MSDDDWMDDIQRRKNSDGGAREKRQELELWRLRALDAVGSLFFAGLKRDILGGVERYCKKYDLRLGSDITTEEHGQNQLILKKPKYPSVRMELTFTPDAFILTSRYVLRRDAESEYDKSEYQYSLDIDENRKTVVRSEDGTHVENLVKEFLTPFLESI